MKKIITILVVILAIIFSFPYAYPKIKTWTHKQKWKELPEHVYVHFCKFDEFNYSKCRKIDELPVQIQKWEFFKPATDETFYTIDTTPYYFKFTDLDGYLLIFYREESNKKSSYAFWLTNEGSCTVVSEFKSG